jgi:hypothetical protein
MDFDGARSELQARYLLIRCDPFIVDPSLWLQLGYLAVAMHDTRRTRLAWEGAAGTPAAVGAEGLHRLAHRVMVAALADAAAAAGLLDLSPPGGGIEPDLAVPGVPTHDEPNRPHFEPCHSAGRGWRPTPTPYTTKRERA